MDIELNDLHRDMLSEVCNMAMSQATYTTSQLRGQGREATFDLPDIEVMSKRDFITGVGLEYKNGLIVQQVYSGALDGALLMCFSKDSERKISKIYFNTDKEIEEVEGIEVATICEIGNIFMNSFITHLRRFLNVSIQTDLPRMFFTGNYPEMLTSEMEQILILRSIFRVEDIHIEGKICMCMSDHMYERLLSKIGKCLGVL